MHVNTSPSSGAFAAKMNGATVIYQPRVCQRMQSGGAEAVEAEEAMTMTLQPGPKGLLMRCIPRACGQL